MSAASHKSGRLPEGVLFAFQAFNELVNLAVVSGGGRTHLLPALVF